MNSKRKRNNRDECEEPEFRQQMKCTKCGYTTNSDEATQIRELEVVDGETDTFFASWGKLFCPQCIMTLLEQHCGVMEDLDG